MLVTIESRTVTAPKWLRCRRTEASSTRSEFDIPARAEKHPKREFSYVSARCTGHAGILFGEIKFVKAESIHARRNPFRRCIPARGGSLWAGTIVSAGPTSRRVLRARYNRNHPERLLRPAQCRGALIPVVLPRMRGILTSTEIAPCPRRPSKLDRPVMESTFGWERCLPQREKADRHDDARILPGNSIVGVIGRPALQYVLNTGDSPPAIWRAIVWAWK